LLYKARCFFFKKFVFIDCTFDIRIDVIFFRF